MTKATRAALIEWVTLFVLVFAAARDIPDPSRLVALVIGHAPEWRFPDLRQGVALVAGIGNLWLAIYLVSAVSDAPWARRLRQLAIGWFVFALVILPTLRDIELRWRVDEAPGNTRPFMSQSHDGGTVQTEMALARLVAGENPYGDHYSGAPMNRSVDSDPEAWQRLGATDNPAFHHLTYLPAVLEISLPFYALGRALGHYDERFVYLIAALLLVLALGRFVDAGDGHARRMIVMLVWLNPLLRPYLVTGRNDVIVLFPLVLCALYLDQKRLRAAAIALGCALALKQFALFIVPGFVVYVWTQCERDRRRSLAALWPIVAIPLLTILPFALWDLRALVDDTLLWTSRGGEGAYPLKWIGWGLTVLAYGLNVIDAPLQASPFGVAAPIAELATMSALCADLYRRPSVSRLFLHSAILVTVVLLFARAYSMSYAATPLLLVALAVLSAKREEARPAERHNVEGEGGKL